ncbi:MAG TPA: TetR/AcrR family transcriptional regulator [Ktedonobacterales bacterium]|jgi:TetR/AcrR family transcriptional repressor of nem operon
MRRTKQAKQQTHERIVAAATRRFRAGGIAGVGVADVMGEAGLTHGGFYAHFASKDALVAEACGTGLAQSRERLIRKIQREPVEKRLAAYIDLYLSADHRDHPEAGCVMPALSGEVARSSGEVRAAFTQAYNDYRAALASLLTDTDNAGEDEAPDEAMVLLAGLAGTMLLARAVDDPELSERMLRVNRDYYKRAFGGRHAPDADVRPQG